MALIKSPLPENVQKIAGDALQGTLVDLVDLSLIAKQVHWTIVGRNFRSIHLQLDDVVETARQYTDTAAERAAAIGVLPDGRFGALKEQSRVPQPPVEWISAEDAISFFVDVFDQMVARMRERIDATEDDQVTQDLLIEITAALEKHYWMWQAENQSR
ncbi:DNA starvation/stationary phase protection protein [Blastococcus sp. MG754426]|uniref:Dps family protein n=1 Tax=unclassified Blastococcus TaxID=2619396 RepID=UPI001EEFE7AE|nr:MULTISPECIES: DNA starvation/stationary phase protection protein [unclassified Blastococcus]MCF6507456.1 DNA starvation/stationary phase protection protein [Blastococcus sp. MG754426]MCF6512573.1 DNA starvation/stationary phase protection protein [Blastococcus sp. MG754427]